jgi:glycine hydroxymethyltransferase
VLWDARPTGVSGAKLEKLLEMCSISVNKNSVVGDTSAVSPGGIRLGTPAMTTRGMDMADMEAIAGLLDRVVHIASRVQGSLESKKLVDFLHAVKASEEAQTALAGVKRDAEALAKTFPLPGIVPTTV